MHLPVILLIVLLVFGPKKLGEIGKSLGEGMRAFRQDVRDCESSGRIRGCDGACSTPLTPSQESAARALPMSQPF